MTPVSSWPERVGIAMSGTHHEWPMGRDHGAYDCTACKRWCLGSLELHSLAWISLPLGAASYPGLPR